MCRLPSIHTQSERTTFFYFLSLQIYNRQHKENLEQNKDRSKCDVNKTNVSIFSLWFVSSVSNSLFNRYQIRGFSIQSKHAGVAVVSNFLFSLFAFGCRCYFIYMECTSKIHLDRFHSGDKYFFFTPKIESQKQRKLQISFGTPNEKERNWDWSQSEKCRTTFQWLLVFVC